MRRRGMKILWIVLAVVIVLVAIGAIYVGNYSKALPEAQAVAETMQRVDGNLTLMGDSGKGILIYPGGKVEAAAYAPLAQLLNTHGDTVVIVEMPLRLAILGSGRAERAMKDHPEVDSWFIVGHSLGGTAASMFVSGHPDAVDGIVFLASYPSASLLDFDGAVLSIDGSEDGVVNRDKQLEAQAKYLRQVSVATIEGGNHAGFGTYGAQSGDGVATIAPQTQQVKTSAMIIAERRGD